MRRDITVLFILGASCDLKDPSLICEEATVTGFSDSAYVFTGYDLKCEGRTPPKATLKLNETSFTDFFKGAEALTKLEATDVSTSSSGAKDRWNAVGANVSLDIKVRSYGVRDVDDTKTVLKEKLAPEANKFGEAFVMVYNEDTIDCDVVIYSEHRKTTSSGGTVTNWTTSSTIPDNGLNLQDAMTHEFGHCLGLGDQTSSTHSASMMTQWGLGETRNVLSSTDIDALKFLYPPS